MKRIVTTCIVCLVCIITFMVPASANGGVVIDPANLEVTLEEGETQNAMITVALPESVPRGDVVFVFDTTGWLSNVLYAMKIQGIQVMNQIRTVIADTQFGAGSFMDYPHTYPSYYGYTSPGYGCGSCGDYAWKLDQDLTDDIDAVSIAINRIPFGNGYDFPQDYTRVIYESQFYSWRSDAKKIYIIFGDAPPHGAPSGSSIFTEKYGLSPWGGDPGRDEIPYTADDLDYVPVIDDIAKKNINIVGVYLPYGGVSDPPGNDAEVNFKYMSGKTDGLYLVTDPNADPTDLSTKIVAMIRDMAKKPVRELTLAVREPDLAGWVTWTPGTPYTNLPWPSTKEFGIEITPVGANPGQAYLLHIDVVGDGVVLGTVPVTVNVRENQVTEPIPVSVDIKPGSCPNSFNVKGKGVLPVAILGNGDLQVSRIDPESIVLSREGEPVGVKPVRSAVEDVASPPLDTCSCGYISEEEDGLPDLTLKFDSQAVAEILETREDEECIKLVITGILQGSNPEVPGTTITGSDFLRILDTGNGSCGDDNGKGDREGECDHDREGDCDRQDDCDRDDDCDEEGDHGSRDDGQGKGSPGDKGSGDTRGSSDDRNHGDGKGSRDDKHG